jgi:hypothetical protein
MRDIPMATTAQSPTGDLCRGEKTKSDIQEYLAIDDDFNNTFESISIIKIPAGEKINIGIAGPFDDGSSGFLSGGWNQIIPPKDYPLDWIEDTIPTNF